MLQNIPRTVYLKDYRPPDYLVETVDLRFDLGEEVTKVQSRLRLTANYDLGQGVRPLVLDGQDLTLESIALDDRPLAEGDYSAEPESLTIARPCPPGSGPASFTLDIATRIKPQENTSLEGLYKSSGNFCTQCEAEGFRKMTYYLDRPDVMARFTTTIIADRELYPVLLSNGNLIEQGELEGNRHFACWQDPFKKPCYLFALVAGKLVRIEDSFVTRSGRQVALHLYVQEQNRDKCEHAMRSLKKAMRWDEEAYGREYDLDVYMIVAVDDFNMGAMENKGLNLFNSKYVLAKPETATDSDYEGIQGVIGHEYFHNWSGNRITCRDWFQLSLKEGFTVFREQQFTADMTKSAVKRIHDVRGLRTHQFAEDAGPMAHPVRPESYVEINNFYTSTVYSKGAEVVRMLHNLLGPAGFRKGTDLYFQRHDGQAVTTDDFVRAMEDANEVNLIQFRLWYSQAGTPELSITCDYDAESRTYTLTVRQSCPPTPGQPEKEPFHIPLAMSLLGRDGQDLPLQLAGEEAPHQGGTRVLAIREPEQTFRFMNIPEPPVPSLLCGFSAPVKLNIEYSDEDLAFLLAHDSDDFNRWEAGQKLALKILLKLIEGRQQGRVLSLESLSDTTRDNTGSGLTAAFRATLEHPELDRALIAEVLTLPSEGYIAEFTDPIDPMVIHEARDFLRGHLARELRHSFSAVYRANHGRGPYHFDAQSAGSRSLKNLCLAYLMELLDPEALRLCTEQFRHADNMTDQVSALATLANADCPQRLEALAAFYEQWKAEPLVLDKWLAIQATSRLPGTLQEVKALTRHPAFNIRNPNKVRSLIGAFCQSNPVRFHDASGAGYELLADYVLELNRLNPQVAARLLGAMTRWRRYDATRQALMKAQLERILAAPGLSKDVYEIAAKSLT